MVHDLKFEVVDYERGNSKPVEEASDLDVTAKYIYIVKNII